jgi:hypothetical protein
MCGDGCEKLFRFITAHNYPPKLALSPERNCGDWLAEQQLDVRGSKWDGAQRVPLSALVVKTLFLDLDLSGRCDELTRDVDLQEGAHA